MIGKIKRFTNNRIRIFKTKTKDHLYGKKNYGKFVVVTRSRTGSNLLMSLLNDHKDIRTYGERFNRLKGRSTGLIYNKIFPKKATVNWVGFKLFYYHPLDSDDKTIWDKIKNDRDVKIIHLRRENLLRVYISRIIAGKSNTWLKRTKSNVKVETKRIEINVEDLVKDIHRTNQYIEETNKLFQNHSVLNLTFEELVNNKESIINNVFSFLNVSPMLVKSTLKRQNSESIEDLVSNYNELYSKLENTELAYLLEDKL